VKKVAENNKPSKHNKKEKGVSKLVPATFVATNFNSSEKIWK
jgi:hypothetical protein